jgi:3-isopropylmalate/(R)-2-methylmalate dehydratase small subunit
VPSAAALPEENSDFELNQPPWRHAPVLLTGRNFGCGSSREHAAWALQDYGVRAIIAPSFGDIFYNNALKVGLLPVRVREEVTTAWIEAAQEQPGLEAVVDLEAGFIEFCGQRQPIEIDADARERLLGGLDEIALTEQHVDAITAFESRRAVWLPRTDAVTAR